MPHISYTNPVCMWVFAFVAMGAISSRSEADKPAEKVWSTSNFLDFADGSFSDGGVNTYVTADGTVRLINQWDLDNDGNIDVVLPNDHDSNDRVDLFIYPGKKGRFDANLWKQLPTDGGQAVPRSLTPSTRTSPAGHGGREAGTGRQHTSQKPVRNAKSGH